jgi:hypothetical protein
VCSLLSPLQNSPSSLDQFLAARHPVVECLHHSAVIEYCAPFGLADTTTSIQQAFALMRRISTSDQAVLQHQIRLFMGFMDETKTRLSAGSNFFIQNYFNRFLDAARRSVDGHLAQTRSRFAAPIVSRLAHDGSIPKRYPLEEGREFIILIPLRNNGPGTALNVQAKIDHDQELAFGTTATNVGDVPPGDFSVAFDVLVVAGSSKVSTILNISWEEMGTLEPKTLAPEVNICAQKIDVPWGTLQYRHPYSTGPAKGDEFVGRREKVASLASKILRTPMEPFYVVGQKRVGKTSLALAAADFAKLQSQEIDYTYVLRGDHAYENPRDFVNALGNHIVQFVRESLPKPTDIPTIKLGGAHYGATESAIPNG